MTFQKKGYIRDIDLEKIVIEDVINYDYPVRITTHYPDNRLKDSLNKTKKRKVILFPFNDLKKKIQRYIEDGVIQKDSRGRISGFKALRKIDATLFCQIAHWGYMFKSNSGKHTFNKSRTLDKMGFQTAGIYSPNFKKEKILQVFTEDFIYKSFNQLGKQSFDMTVLERNLEEKIRNSDSVTREIFEKTILTAPLGSKKFTLEKVLNEAYSYIKKEIGISVYELFFSKSGMLTNNEIKSFIQDTYYDGKDLRESTINMLPKGTSLTYAIRCFSDSSIADSSTSTKKKRKSYSSQVNKFMDVKCDSYDILTDKLLKSSNGVIVGSVSAIAELEFAFFMNIVKKYDPLMNYFPEIKKFIAGSLERVFFPTQKLYLRVLNNHEKNIEADGRIESTKESILWELKSSEYSSEKMFFSSLSKYKNVSRWHDQTRINKKILLIDFRSEHSKEYKRKLENDGWIVIDGKEYAKLYLRALDMNFTNDKNFEFTSPLNTFENHLKLFDLTHDKSHIFYRRGQRFLRNISKELHRRNINYLNSEHTFDGFTRYAQKYIVRLSDLKNIYPFELGNEITADILFKDNEAAGFLNTGSPLITISAGKKIDNDFLVEVYLSRTPFEERDMLMKFEKEHSGYSKEITFNGKKYDNPFDEQRRLANLLRPFKRAVEDIDLFIDHYRKLSSDKKHPQSNLNYYERKNLSIYRREDTSGDKIPELYRKYLLGENVDIMPLIKHNIIDVMSLPFLYMQMRGNLFEKPENQINVTLDDIQFFKE